MTQKEKREAQKRYNEIAEEFRAMADTSRKRREATLPMNRSMSMSCEPSKTAFRRVCAAKSLPRS